jgi:hypothetical protein
VLNHDLVFLAELLLEQQSEPEWAPAYRSFNCLNLPRRGTTIPLAMEYAATLTVVLAHFQIQDHVADSGRLRWKAAARYLSPAYRKAAARLRRWQFPLDALEEVLGTQTAREANPESLTHVAEPTMTATALAFSEGSRICEQSASAIHRMHELGTKFGYLVYLLDAHEDRDRDARTGAFNAAAAFPDIDIRQEILTATSEIATQLPLPLAERLRTNVNRRLGLSLQVVGACCRAASVRGRLREAIAFAQAMRRRESAGILKGAAVLATVGLLAFLFPHQARRTESWRQCLGLSMNLMALSSVFASGAQPPGPPPQPPIASRPYQPHQAVPPPPSGRSGGSCCGCCKDTCMEGSMECCCSGCCESCDCG